MTLVEKEQIKFNYETTTESVRSLAKRFNINHMALFRIAKKENWVKFTDLNLTHVDEIKALEKFKTKNETEIKILDEFKTKTNNNLLKNEVELSKNNKITSLELINHAFNIIDKLHEVHSKALKANDIIINNLLYKLENNIIEYTEAVAVLQRLGAGIDKISAFYKEPAMTNIQINNNKQEEQAPVINIVAS